MVENEAHYCVLKIFSLIGLVIVISKWQDESKIKGYKTKSPIK